MILIIIEHNNMALKVSQGCWIKISSVLCFFQAMHCLKKCLQGTMKLDNDKVFIVFYSVNNFGNLISKSSSNF